MNVGRKISLAGGVAMAIVFSSVACSLSSYESNGLLGNTASVTPEVEKVSEPVTASADAKVEFIKPRVTDHSGDVTPTPLPSPALTAPPVGIVGNTTPPAPSTTPTEQLASSPAAVTVPAPIRADARVKPPVASSPLRKDPVPQVDTSVLPSAEIHVALSGGLDVLDRYSGPVLYDFPTEAGLPPYVAEHDLVGGWERFGSLKKGMTVKITGLVAGTYTVGEIINVPQGGDISELLAFDVRPKVMLQTCIPWSDRMIVVGLY